MKSRIKAICHVFCPTGKPRIPHLPADAGCHQRDPRLLQRWGKQGRYEAATMNQEGAMKQNITLSLEKELIKKGKIIAAKEESSVSKMLSDFLRQIIEKEEQYEAAKRSALQTLKKGFHFGGQITWEREDLYER